MERFGWQTRGVRERSASRRAGVSSAAIAEYHAPVVEPRAALRDARGVRSRIREEDSFMATNERDSFIAALDREAQGTSRLLQSLPKHQYDFRPDAGGRSLGELSWHLAEIEAYTSHGIALGKFDLGGAKPAGIERPRTIEALAPEFERVHRESVERLRAIKPEDLDRELVFFTGGPLRIRDILWSATLHHILHHRGQLVLMCRLAGGTAPGLFGPNREEMAAMRAARG
jgi:uncharacterized damage-inducible protein DinB